MALIMNSVNRLTHIECSKIDAIHACYPKHTHEEYVISANVCGAERIWFDGKQQDVTAGEVTLYNPMTIQASTFTGSQAQFISLHLNSHYVQDILGSVCSSHALPVFVEGKIKDSELFNSIVNLSIQSESRDYEDAQLSFMADLIRFRSSHPIPSAPLRVTRLISFMKSNLYEQIELEDLCTEANLSKFHLVRSFKAEMHLPPMQYFKQLRLIEARRRLRLNESATRIAVDLGFFDQAHMTNAFRKVIGTSPSNYSSMLGEAGLPINSI